jgi:hypothetical protein
MPTETREVGREKLDAVIAWLTQSTPNKAVLWGRFRPEVERTALALREAFGDLHRQELGSHQVELLYGGQKPDDRERAKRLLAPGGSPQPGFVVGSVQAGGAGLNLAAADTAIYLTNTFSLKDRKQSEGRLDRPGQTKRVTFVDVVAWGPAGQKTIDHHVVKALRKKQELADWTASVWRQKLAEE